MGWMIESWTDVILATTLCDPDLYLLNMLYAQNPNAHPRPTSQDLAGFWDMLQLSIENISMKFDELHQLKANNWKQMDPLDKKVEQCRFCMVHLKTCTNTGQSK